MLSGITHFMAKFIPHRTDHPRRKKINSLQTECMDLETELEEQKKDEHSIKDTLNEDMDKVGNISSEVDRAVNTFMKGQFNY